MNMGLDRPPSKHYTYIEKVLSFPWLYGVGPIKLSDIAKTLSQEEAQKILDKFIESFKKVRNDSSFMGS